MKAFVSYSFIDSELYILTLLFEQLRKSGYVVATAPANHSNILSNDLKIKNSDIFLGIITNNSGSINHVIREWHIARQNNIKSILIIEDGVNVQDSNIKFIRFNRQSPNIAINKLFNINSQPIGKSTEKTSPGVENALIAGGIIVGVAALIALLSGENK